MKKNNSVLYSFAIIEAIKNDYEAFRLNTHQLNHKGLFMGDDGIYAVICESSDYSIDKLKEIYEQYRTLCIPPAIIISHVKESFEKIPGRTAFEKSSLYGQPLNMSEFINELNIQIPKIYHPFNADIKWGTNEFKLIFKNELSENDKIEIQLICESIGFQGYEYIFEINPDISDYPGEINFTPNAHNNLQLTASGLIQKQFPRAILDRYEEDEDFWVENRLAVFSGQLGDKRKYLPSEFLEPLTKCFVDASVFERQNLRVYLSLYEQVIIALPLAEPEKFYRIFQINKNELSELIRRGRLLFTAAQNLSRYPKKLLLDILSVNPNSILFSRKLTASTLAGIQKKSGILRGTHSSDEQYEFLNQCSNSDNQELKLIASTLSEQWQNLELIINKQGAISACNAGLSNMLTKLYMARGKDFAIELHSAAMSFEFAQGLNAHHFPFDSEQYSEVNACKSISNLYNGIQSTPKIKESELSLLLSDVLAINNDMSVLELDDALNCTHIRSIPRIIGQYSDLNEEDKKEKLYQLRKELHQLESNNNRLSKLDFSGYLAPAVIGASMEYLDIAGGGYVTIGGWVLKMLASYGSNSNLVDNPIFIKLNAMNHRVSSDTIIVKKCRDSVQSYSNI